MSIDAETLRQTILETVPDTTEVLVDDMRGDGVYYATTVVAGSFEGISKLDRHRIVYHALASVLGSQLDSLRGLQLTTRTPAENSLNTFELT